MATEGSDDIVVNDFVTVKIRIIHEELKEGEKVPPVCSRSFPMIRQENYYVFLTDKIDMHIHSFNKFIGNEREQEKIFKFQAPPHLVGDTLFNVHCMGDSYVGLDTSSELKFSIKKESKDREMHVYDEEDIKRKPTLFEQALQGLNPDNSDDDLEEEEETNESTQMKKKTSKANESDEEIEEEKDD